MEIRRLGRVDYEPTWHAMREFTAARTPESPDELWVVEHPPVFTLGQAGKREHILSDVGIPVVKIDRGGQVTYHGPGQVSIVAERRTGAPGVYVGDAKIAALGLRIRNGCSYHGLSLNVDMDLSPFSAINPCGYAGLKVTQTRDLGIPLNLAEAGELLCRHLRQQLDKTHG